MKINRKDDGAGAAVCHPDTLATNQSGAEMIAYLYLISFSLCFILFYPFRFIPV